MEMVHFLTKKKLLSQIFFNFFLIFFNLMELILLLFKGK